jgi:MFS transporter, BCD family, chlorophyll transporter
MSSLTRTLVSKSAQWMRLGPRLMPFADVVSAQLPLSRLLRLSLFQLSVAMALVLLVGTLNRVMIVEMGIAASWVACMVALPVLWAPLRAVVGFRSDHHRSALGWRRVPFLWMGSLLQFGGFAVMPFALLVLSGAGDSQHWPAWLGPLGAGLTFLVVGAGLHTVQTAGLALATDLVAAEQRPRMVGFMGVMLLVGTIASALLFGALLADYSPGRLVQVLQGAAVATLVLNAVAMWKQEPAGPSLHRLRAFQAQRDAEAGRAAPAEAPQDFVEVLRAHLAVPGSAQRLRVLAIGTLAFSMQDVLLEPFAGQLLALSVGQTTWLTATLASGALLGFALASLVLGRGVKPPRLARLGLLMGCPGFVALLLAAVTASVAVLVAGAVLVGLAAGLFGHSLLTWTLASAPRQQTGLALGAWGAVQATAAGLGVAAGGVLRDAVQSLSQSGLWWDLSAWQAPQASGYTAVFVLELLLLGLALLLLPKLAAQSPASSTPSTGPSPAAAAGGLSNSTQNSAQNSAP